jgi:hypothetical protein
MVKTLKATWCSNGIFVLSSNICCTKVEKLFDNVMKYAKFIIFIFHLVVYYKNMM